MTVTLVFRAYMVKETTVSYLTGCLPVESTTHSDNEEARFELFRRAILENDQGCWEQIVNHCYPRLVAHWVRQCYPPQPYSVDDYVQEVFAHFATKYTPQKLQRAERLASVLSFLKSVTFTIVKDEQRRHQRLVQQIEWTALPEAGASIDLARDLDFDCLITAILNRCQDEREQVIANLKFRNDWKPRQIQAHRPDLFADVITVQRQQESLIRRLRRCPTLAFILKAL